jgi:Mg-chelatase subunit ChlD
MRDALDAAKRIRLANVAALAIDSSPPTGRGDAPTRALAEAMSSRYLKLPLANAAQVNAAVRRALPS